MGFANKNEFKKGDKVVITLVDKEVEGTVDFVYGASNNISVTIDGVEVVISGSSNWNVKKKVKPLPTARGAMIKFYGFAPYVRGRYDWMNLGSFKRITPSDLRDEYGNEDFEVLFDGEGASF